MAQTRIAELATVISNQTAFVDQYLQAHGISSPSFDAEYNEMTTPPKEITASKNAILEATEELNSLIAGPVGYLTSLNTTIVPVFHAIYRWNLASSFPIDGEASFGDIAAKVGVPENDIKRIIRMAKTHRIFREPRDGIVAHTSVSKVIATVPLLNSWLGLITDEIFPAFTRMVDAIERWPNSQEPNETGYNLFTNQFDSYFGGMKNDTHREKRFADVMTFFHAGGKWERAGLIEFYDWNSATEGVVVELGGSQGAMCVDLARHFPKMKCISQDLPDVVADVEVPKDLTDRVEILAHDFFTPQPVRDADVYLFRWIFHDWSDKYSVLILQNLIPALKHGARIVIGEVCLPGPKGNVSHVLERRMRGSDFTMKSCLNGSERSAKEWEQLFASSDSRFKFKGVATVPGSRYSVIEATWEGDSPA
ncbi:Sterigmatocystin 8-O-methyltransferase protein [Rutstroemia sp. NJR-2017a WRK4]|nr:Sterigmatocystin 8-O-methyltransferase protein [Rutstroemia sp. NJR-2017a WRK4]